MRAYIGASLQIRGALPPEVIYVNACGKGAQTYLCISSPIFGISQPTPFHQFCITRNTFSDATSDNHISF